MEKLKCLFVSSEVAPYAKTGGLADVVGALPKELIKQGVDVRVAMPYYQGVRGKFEANEPVANFPMQLDWRDQYVEVFEDKKEVTTYFFKDNFDNYFNREGLYGYDDDFERFAFFCKAVLESFHWLDFYPDVIHCNDWQTGPICLLLKDKYSWRQEYKNIKTLFTIHNMKFQGIFPPYALDTLELTRSYLSPDKLEFNGGASYMKAGLLYADHITTVSPSYVDEIKTPDFGCGLDGLLRNQLYWRLTGILNGIDLEEFNPETDAKIWQNYGAKQINKKVVNKREFQKAYGLNQDDNTMMIAMITRLSDQKGLDLMKQVVEDRWVMDKIMELNVQFVVLGTGEEEYENMFKHFAHEYAGRAVYFPDFNVELSHKIYAASDAFLMPSAFEPCGLGQLIAMRYGSVPIVRKTGGLKDTVSHYNYETREGRGFEFEEYNGYWLYQKVKEASKCFDNNSNQPNGHYTQVQYNCMISHFGWADSATKYLDLYNHILGRDGDLTEEVAEQDVTQEVNSTQNVVEENVSTQEVTGASETDTTNLFYPA
ncbi:MAG: starch synthase [Epulopiscium sp. Nele67-Bin005]|nr:MAG: starch synthase [Epulopiscium sp. Nele67-Bin005]